MTSHRKLSMLALALATTGLGFADVPGPTWQLTDTGSTARFRGLAPVNAQVAWAAGSAGTILRTIDGGRTWASVGPADAATLQFRDIEAFGPHDAVALTIGNGTDSRIYRTTDGGANWTLTFRNDDPAAFYDCITFLDRRHGLALSDPVDGKFRILATRDGGRTWNVQPTSGMPAALPGEFAFAASGTCLTTVTPRPRHTAGPATTASLAGLSPAVTGLVGTGTALSGPSAAGTAPRDPSAAGVALSAPSAAGAGSAGATGGGYAWFATGGDSVSRVFATRDGGRTWRVTDTPVPSGASAGIYSLAFRDPHHGIAVGGDYATETSAPDGSAVTRDGGRTWTVSRTEPGEYRSGAAWRGHTALAVGPTGSDISYDGGNTWRRFDTGSFDAVACTPDGACWASGRDGRIARLSHH